MSFRIRLNGEIVEDFDPYLSRYGMTALWLTAQHLGAKVTWDEDQRVVDISSGSKLSEWLSDQLRSWTTNGVDSRCEPSLPPPELLDTLPRENGSEEPSTQRSVHEAEEDDTDRSDGEEHESSGRDTGHSSRPAQTNAVVHHRPYFRGEGHQQGSGRTVVSSSSRRSRPLTDHDLLARYRPG